MTKSTVIFQIAHTHLQDFGFGASHVNDLDVAMTDEWCQLLRNTTLLYFISSFVDILGFLLTYIIKKLTIVTGS